MCTSRTIQALLVMMSGVLLVGVTAQGQTVIYVDDDASTNGDGASWPTAYKYLQDALAQASTNGVATEIRVAQGTYKPDQDEGGNVSPGDRGATFQLISGVTLYGGFAGLANPADPDERDIAPYATILSGDLNGDDGPDFANNNENSNHVVTGRYIDEATVLDGFTITGGNADSYLEKWGAGMSNTFHSSPTLINCNFRANSAEASGGGMDNYASNPTLINCTFSGNRTTAGIPTLGFGGGMRNRRSSPILINCAFSWNSANTGGAIDNFIDCTLKLTNCTFAGNTADHGRALACDSPHGQPKNRLQVGNCILWNGGGEIWNNDGSTITISYSDVQGGWAGQGNINVAPLFVDADGPDDVAGTEDDDLRLLSGSPCIDAGSNGAVPADGADLDGDGDTSERTPLDLGGKPRFMDDPGTVDSGVSDPPAYVEIVDMGAYEFSPIFLDIKPGSCPNPLNRKSHSVLHVALLGTADFDATTMDISSVLLARADGVGGVVAPTEGPPGPHSVFEDVATPFGGEPCDCHELGGDGIVDLSMKFRTDDVVAELELGDLNPGDEIELVVTASLVDGTEFTSSGDCILIVPPGPANLAIASNAAGVYVDVAPADLTVDGGGFPAFERSYEPGTVITLAAPSSADGRSFRAWKINGVLWTTGQTVIDVTMIESMTARALYCSQTIKDPGLGVYQGSPTPFER